MIRAVLMLLLVTLVPQSADGQSLAVSGRVSDDTGAVLPGVSVQLRTENSTEVARTVTNALGRYELQAQHRGTYQMRFSLINFGHVMRTVALDANRATNVDVVLPLALTAEVTVTARRTFRNLVEIENPAESLIGIADAASEGAVTARQLEGRPLSRQAEPATLTITISPVCRASPPLASKMSTHIP